MDRRSSLPGADVMNLLQLSPHDHPPTTPACGFLHTSIASLSCASCFLHRCTRSRASKASLSQAYPAHHNTGQWLQVCNKGWLHAPQPKPQATQMTGHGPSMGSIVQQKRSCYMSIGRPAVVTHTQVAAATRKTVARLRLGMVAANFAATAVRAGQAVRSRAVQVGLSCLQWS
jgi:hypothetical protein